MDYDKTKLAAQELFHTDAVMSFDVVDPYHQGNQVIGWLCRAEGAFYGSIYR